MTTIIGHRKGMASGPHLYSTAGQILISTAAGTTAALAVPASAAVLGHDGTNIAWQLQGTKAVAADVTHTQSNTTLSDVTGLLIPIGASATEIWFFECYPLITSTSTTVDIKFGFTFPTAATMKWGAISAAAAAAGFVTTGTGTPTAIAVQTDTCAFGTLSGTTGTPFGGYIFGGGTAGNVQLQFAQNTSTAVDLTVAKGSMIRYQKIAA